MRFSRERSRRRQESRMREASSRVEFERGLGRREGVIFLVWEGRKDESVKWNIRRRDFVGEPLQDLDSGTSRDESGAFLRMKSSIQKYLTNQAALSMDEDSGRR